MPIRIIPKLRKGTICTVVGSIGFLLTSILATYLYKKIQSHEKRKFNYEVSLILNQVKNRLEKYESALIQTRALFLSIPNISDHRFQDYINKTELLKRYPDIQGLGYAAIIEPGNLVAFKKKVRTEIPTFNIWPDYKRDLYTSIVFLEPKDKKNLKAIGYDMFSEPVRRRAMEQARDSGNSVLTGAIELVQAYTDHELGFNLYVPVYKENSSINTIEERRANLIGYIYCPFRAESFFKEIYKISKPLVSFKAYASATADPHHLIYSRYIKKHSMNPLRANVVINLGHREYFFSFESLPLFNKSFSYQSVLLTITVGITITLLLISLLYILRSRNDDLEKNQLAVENITENFKNLFMQIPDFVCILKYPNHTFNFTNDSYVRAIGFDPIGKKFEEVHPESFQMLNHLDEVYQTGETILLHEFPVSLKKQGNKRFLNIAYVPHKDVFGRIDGVMIIAAEVTEEVEIREKFKDITDTLAFVHRSAKMGVWTFNFESDELILSKEALRILGLSHFEGGWNKYLTEIVFNNDRELISKEIHRAVRERNQYSCEHRIVKTDGEVRWVLNQGQPRYLDDGRPLSITGVIMDVTEKKSSEKELNYQLQLTQIIIDNAASCLFVMDYKGYPTYMNPAGRKFTGYELEEISDKPLHFSIHYIKTDGTHYPIDDCPIEAAHRNLEALQNKEEFFVDKFGRIYPVSYSVSPLFKEGEVIGSVLEFRDISDEKKRQRQLEILAETSILLNSSLLIHDKLKTITEKGRQIVDCHQGLVVLYDEGSNDLEINSYSCSTKYKKCNKDEFIKSLKDDELLEFKNPVVLLKSEVDNFTDKNLLFVPLIRSDGTNLGLMKFADKQSGQFTREDEYFILQLSQISSAAIENSQLLKKEKEAVKARDEFLSIASHELKTPLTTLSLHIQIHEREMKKNSEQFYSKEKVDKLVGIFSRQIGRLTRLIDDMLDVSRISTKKLSIEKSRFELKMLLEEMLERLSTLFESNSIKTPKLNSLGNTIGFWDRFRLEQVIENLITNALRYGNGKPISISLKADDRSIELSVKDEGMGISKDMCERIFNRFERAASGKEIRGLGLGLYISQQIVQAHGGKIWVESEIGVGSNFIVKLPKNLEGKPLNIGEST